jgi:hypothetical protein
LRIDADDHASTRAAIATVGPALGNIFLAPKADAPIAALSGLHVDFSLIDKEHLAGSESIKKNAHDYAWANMQSLIDRVSCC